jgi:hypothetical protein
VGLHQGQPASGTKNLSNSGDTPQVETVLLDPGTFIQSTTETGRYRTVGQLNNHKNSPQGHNRPTRSFHHLYHAPPRIFMAKWDIKDGFWRLDAEEGAELNFSYVLPQHPREPIYLVVPTSL